MKKNIPNMILMHILSHIPSLIIGLITIILAIMILGKIDGSVTADPIDLDVYDVLESRLAKHSEFDAYTSKPRITYLTTEFLQSAAAGNLIFFTDAKPGYYLLEYSEGFSAIYDAEKDVVVNALALELAPPDLLDKLTAREELANLIGLTPQIIRVGSENLEVLAQQMEGLGEDNIGHYVLNYQGAVILYDYENDEVINTYTPPVAEAAPVQDLPEDFFAKLYAHAELEGFENSNPIGGIVDQPTIDSLQQLNPDIAQVTAIGDFALRIEDRLFIFNYETDTIKGVFQFEE